MQYNFDQNIKNLEAEINTINKEMHRTKTKIFWKKNKMASTADPDIRSQDKIVTKIVCDYRCKNRKNRLLESPETRLI